ncbi:universal stress protein [Streptomyces aurantiogriseus]|uniref:Stress-inducible protein n=1 Tax=Streptomyces aurantiogriseus TaxID=66870 RepID=A0A918FFK6_9ACTN|nr:universal stress protein [Streptomyces aurantiogriseus]GGR34958.1 stress-inducible protein [Streptomyces aurantiogriseus]
MSRTVTVGLDGSPESLAAADWAAREALLLDAALRIVHAGEAPPHSYRPFAGEAVPPPGADRSTHMLREAEASLAYRHPGLPVIADRVAGQAAAGLVAAAEDAQLLVLGSRGLGRTAGFLLGSVALAVVARAQRPVVLVRAGAGSADEHMPGVFGTASRDTPYRDVVLGLDLADPHDAVIEFAFAAASRRAAGLRVVHGWNPPGLSAVFADIPDAQRENELAQHARQKLADTLSVWRDKYPGVEVTEEAVIGQAGPHLADAARNASLVVVGRKNRTASLGPHIGPVAHAVLHHASAPVVVVPHD